MTETQKRARTLGKRLVPSQGEKTHCPWGHPYTPDNTYYYLGARACRRCSKERRRHKSNKRPSAPRRAMLHRVLWKLDAGKCRYCEAPATEEDHVVARCNNGDINSLYNVVLSCHDCNAIKGREGGFTLSKKRELKWRGQLVAPGHLFGEPLMAQVKEQRLRRQKRQGLTHMVAYATKKEGGAQHE